MRQSDEQTLRPPDADGSAMCLLRVMLAVTLVVPLALFLVISWRNYEASVADATLDLVRLSEVGRENANKIFDSQDQLCDQVNELVGGLTDDGIRANELPLHDSLARMVARLPHVASVMVASKGARPLVSAGMYPAPRDADLRDRDYFKAVIGGHQGPFVSSLQVGDVHRQPFFGLGRPWTGPDGDLRGVIDVAVSPLFFADFYQVLLGEAAGGGEQAGGVQGRDISLIRDDGQTLARHPSIEGAPSALTAPGGFLEAIRAHPAGGRFTGRGIVGDDTPPRLYAYSKVRGYPLYVIAGQSWHAILAEWRMTALDHLLFGIPAACVLFAVTRTALVRSRREEAALRRAKQEISRREVAEDTLLRAQRLEAVGQLTGGVAHDFNNLLTVILGSATMIDRRADDVASVRRLTANIQLASKRGAEITQQLLAFAGRQMVRPEVVDLNRRLRVFKPLLERAAGEAVRLEFDFADDLHPVRIDPGQFEAAILNLVGNARDAMPGGGNVVIATRNAAAGGAGGGTPSGPCVRVTVSDTGVGMDRDTVAKAFEPFFTTKGVGKGTGLGLSQVYGFARQAGGLAGIASTAGVGTDVEIMLPATGAARGAPPHRLPPGRKAADGGVVLVVEDEPHVLELAVETLRDLGYEALAAPDGRAALQRLRQAGRVDVLFSDIVMPGGMNGVQLCDEARRLRPGLKVVLTSGHAGIRCDDLPADVGLLVKPYNRAQLGQQLEAAVLGRGQSGAQARTTGCLLAAK